MSNIGTPITGTPSPALLEAQARLLARRAGIANASSKENSQRPFSALNNPAWKEEPQRPLNLNDFPAHLGWGDERLTAVLRAVGAGYATADDEIGNVRNSPKTSVDSPNEERPLPKTIAIFGHVLDAIHRQKEDSLGRVWLLLRLLDESGEGRVPVELVREELTERNGRLYCYSWRRLRQLLQQGEDRFWHRDQHNQYIYYHSEARVAKELDIDRIRGWAVKIPVADLLGSVAELRALFHDCFHSARGDGLNEPITRRVMESRGGGDPRTQRKYEQMRGVESRANYANMGEYSKEALAWHQGLDAEEDFEDKALGPAFPFVDFNGTLGHSLNREQRPKHQQHWHKIYILRQMANTYEGTLRTAKRGRKWTNRKLSALCNTKKVRGSCEETIRLYYGSEKAVERGRGRPLGEYFVAQTEMVWVVAVKASSKATFGRTAVNVGAGYATAGDG